MYAFLLSITPEETNACPNFLGRENASYYEILVAKLKF